MNIEEALAAAKRPERVVQICLRGDLLAEHDALVEELQRAESESLVGATAGSLAGDGGRSRELAAAIADLEQQMVDASIPFRLRGLGRSAWTKLMADHPPREGDMQDRGLGANFDTFFPAAIRACTVEPQLTPSQWNTLLEDTLTSAQYEKLADAVFNVNRGSVDIPFSRTALRVAMSYENGHGRQLDSASLSNGSRAGSPPPSPSTSETVAAGSSSPSRAAKPNGTKNSRRSS